MSSQQEPPAPTPEELAYQEAHAHESRAALVNTIQIMMMVVSLVVVVGRLIARKLSTQPFKADDYTIILSLVRDRTGQDSHLTRSKLPLLLII